MTFTVRLRDHDGKSTVVNAKGEDLFPEGIVQSQEAARVAAFLKTLPEDVVQGVTPHLMAKTHQHLGLG